MASPCPKTPPCYFGLNDTAYAADAFQNVASANQSSLEIWDGNDKAPIVKYDSVQITDPSNPTQYFHYLFIDPEKYDIEKIIRENKGKYIIYKMGALDKGIPVNLTYRLKLC